MYNMYFLQIYTMGTPIEIYLIKNVIALHAM